MTGSLKNSLRRSFEKNAPEVRAFLSGQIPSFVTQRRGSASLAEVPVFVFHAVEPERLDIQLLYLRSNDYRTLDANELEAAVRWDVRKGREVALTFDDATWTFWTYAFPLLKRYGFRAILFAIPGIAPDDSTLYPNLEDVWEGRCIQKDLERRGEIQPLCTWRELVLMHESGIVDVQSHSLTHARVSVSPRLVDFLHPGFDADFKNVNVPISLLDNQEHPERKLRLGAPVFESAPRMACRLWFKEAPELVAAMTGYVEDHGANAFFGRPNWRKELVTFFRRWPPERLGSFETSEEMVLAVRRELFGSRKTLEERLPGKVVRHFCYHWFVGSDTADRLAAQVGYRTVHYGIQINGRPAQSARIPFRIRRISEEYLLRLPGHGRLPIWSISSILANRVFRFIRRITPGL
ncbi:MAG: polysaccharide deacetylase family protein [Candidatus Binatia bacterium]